jgi:hypothetical protein
MVESGMKHCWSIHHPMQNGCCSWPEAPAQPSTGGRTVRFAECKEGDYRIFVGAMEAPGGDGYTAALVVERVLSTGDAKAEAFRDESLACGYRWPSADAAMAYAMNRARDMVRSRSPSLGC